MTDERPVSARTHLFQSLALAAGPALIALILSWRTLRWPFLWDDFDFLGRVARLRLQDFLPVDQVVFYRPISRELYFWIVSHVLGGTPLAGHLLNATVVILIIVLLMSLAQKLARPKAALVSGLVFACSAALPLVTGWISASQDLLCLLFALLGFRLQVSRKPFAAALAMAAACLSKETAIVLIPVPITIEVLRRAPRSEIRRTVLAHASVLILWALVHPWTRGLLSGIVLQGTNGGDYVAFRGISAVMSSLRGLALSLNLWWIGATMRWTGQNVLPAIAASAIIVYLMRRSGSAVASDDEPVAESSTLLGIGLLTVLGPVALTSLTLSDWSPHYAIIPAAGWSLLAGAVLSSRGKIAVFTILAFLWLGISVRDMTGAPTIPSELNFAETAQSLGLVENGFKRLHPTLPAESNVYVSVQAKGHGGLYRQLFRFQPLRVWYGHPDIWVLDPNRYRAGAKFAFLFWITPQLDVLEIDTQTLAPKGATSIDLFQYQKTLRGYAFGLTAAGQVDRAVSILFSMPERSQDVAIFDRRSAGMLLMAVDRDADAFRLLAGVPSFDHAGSIAAATALLIEPVAGLDLDVAAMRAFGLNPTDEPTLEELMSRLDAVGSTAGAARFARRLQIMNPGNRASAALLDKVSRAPRRQEITAPIPYDIPQ